MSQGISVESVLCKLDGVRKVASGWSAKCPMHQDDHASLSVAVGDTGSVIMHCHVGCSFADIVGRIGLNPADLCNGERERLPVHRNGKAPTNGNGSAAPAVAEQGKGPKLREVATYDYVDEQGELLFQKVRFEPKTFRVRRPDGDGGWIWSIGETRKVLFNLPAVQKAVAAGIPVLVVEGEKDVLALGKMGFTATCNFDGASKDGQKPKWKEGYSEALRGGKVVVIPDADSAGRAHAAAAAESLRPVVAELRVIELPGLGDAGDASDWIAAGGTKAGLVALVRATPEWEAPSKKQLDAGETKDGPSDYALAERYAEDREESYRYMRGDQWYSYEAGEWSYCGLEMAQADLQWWLDRLKATDKEAKTMKITRQRVGNALFLAKSRLGPHPLSIFNQHAEWVHCRNCILDTRTGQRIEHGPKNYITYVLPYDYIPEAECPVWMRFLGEAMAGPGGKPVQEWIDAIQEWFGYCLIPDANRAQVSMVWVGDGGNGKGTATRRLEKIAGDGQYTAVSVEQLHDPYHRAQLFGKLVGLVNELDRRALQKNGDVFKAITGGDQISARNPGEKVFTFRPTIRLTVTCNDLPSTRDLSYGYFRRLVLIEWRNTPAEPDALLDDKLDAEMPGILNWALEGLHRFRERGYRFAPLVESEAIKAEYALSQDPTAMFVDEWCELRPEAKEASEVLYAAFRRWCKKRFVEEKSVPNEIAFGARISKITKQKTEEAREAGGPKRRFKPGIMLQPSVSGFVPEVG